MSSVFDVEQPPKKDLIDRYQVYRRPFLATLELTERCNLRCTHCYMTEYQEFGLSKHTLFRVLKEMRELGAYELLLTGGEPLIRPDFLEIAEYARRLGFLTNIFTNAVLIDETLATELARIGINEVSTSIYSMDPEVHDARTMRRGSLKKTTRGVELCAEAGLNIEVKSVFSKATIESFDGIRDYCDERGFNFLPTITIFPQRNGNTDVCRAQVTPEQAQRVMPEINHRIGLRPVPKDPDDFLCCESQYHVFVHASGDVAPCNMVTRSYGNVVKSSLQEIWDGSGLRRFQDLRWKDAVGCLSCPRNEFCSHCGAISEMWGHDFLEPNPTLCFLSEQRERSLTLDSVGAPRCSPRGQVCALRTMREAAHA